MCEICGSFLVIGAPDAKLGKSMLTIPSSIFLCSPLLFIYLSMFVYLSMPMLTITLHLFFYISIYQSIFLSISIHLFFYLIHLSIHPFTYLSCLCKLKGSSLKEVVLRLKSPRKRAVIDLSFDLI